MDIWVMSWGMLGSGGLRIEDGVWLLFSKGMKELTYADGASHALV